MEYSYLTVMWQNQGVHIHIQRHAHTDMYTLKECTFTCIYLYLNMCTHILITCIFTNKCTHAHLHSHTQSTPPRWDGGGPCFLACPALEWLETLWRLSLIHPSGWGWEELAARGSLLPLLQPRPTESQAVVDGKVALVCQRKLGGCAVTSELQVQSARRAQ